MQRRAAEQFQAEMKRIAADPDPMGLRRLSAQTAAQASAAVMQRQRFLQLQPGQSCLGGFAGRLGTVVVRSVQNGVQVATQLSENGRPVQCVGNQRVNQPVPQRP